MESTNAEDRGQTEERGAEPHRRRARGEGPAGPERVRQAPGRKGHGREDVRVDGHQVSERGGRDREGAHQVLGDHGGGDAMKVRKEVEGSGDEDDEPAEPERPGEQISHAGAIGCSA